MGVFNSTTESNVPNFATHGKANKKLMVFLWIQSYVLREHIPHIFLTTHGSYFTTQQQTNFLWHIIAIISLFETHSFY